MRRTSRGRISRTISTIIGMVYQMRYNVNFTQPYNVKLTELRVRAASW